MISLSVHILWTTFSLTRAVKTKPCIDYILEQLQARLDEETTKAEVSVLDAAILIQNLVPCA